MNKTKDRYVLIKMAAVFCAPCGAQEAAAIIRTAVEVLVRKEGLDFEDPDDREVFERASPSPLEWSKRPVFLSGPSTTHAALVDHYWRPEAQYHYLVVSLDSDIPEGELGQEWPSLLKWSEQVVRATAPHFAFAWSKWSEEKINPIDYESLKADTLPKTILPWTLLGEQCLRGVKDKLAALPAYRSEALELGWLLHVVAVPGQPPVEGFVDALRSIGPQYVDLLLK